MASKKKPRIRPVPTPLFAVPASLETWNEYIGWFALRRLPVPPVPEHSIFIGDARGLICGAGLYPTKGPYVFAEHLATNPSCPSKLRHRAVSSLAAVARAYCATTAKFPLIVIRHRALVRILMRAGYVTTPGIIMTAPQGVNLG